MKLSALPVEKEIMRREGERVQKSQRGRKIQIKM